VTTELTLLTLDVRSNRPNNPVFVSLDFYNANENLLSTFTEFICWTSVTLSDVNGSEEFINTNLTAAGMGTQKGLVVSDRAVRYAFPIDDDEYAKSVTLLGVVTTSVYDGTCYSYSYSLYHDNSYTGTAFYPN
jgi:hypothetical protein